MSHNNSEKSPEEQSTETALNSFIQAQKLQNTRTEQLSQTQPLKKRIKP